VYGQEKSGCAPIFADKGKIVKNAQYQNFRL